MNSCEQILSTDKVGIHNKGFRVTHDWKKRHHSPGLDAVAEDGLYVDSMVL